MTLELCVASIFAAYALTLIGLLVSKIYFGRPAGPNMRDRKPIALMDWLSAIFTAAVFTFVGGDMIAIALHPLEKKNYDLAQTVGLTSLGLVFFSTLFVFAFFNKPTRLRAILALGTTSALISFLYVLHSLGWIHVPG